MYISTNFSRGAGYTGIIGKDTHTTFNQISMQNVDMTANADYAGVLAANASQSQMTDILVAETQVKTSSSYVGKMIGNADAVSVQKAFVDAELNIPYTFLLQIQQHLLVWQQKIVKFLTVQLPAVYIRKIQVPPDIS